MTVSSTTRRAELAGNDTATTFSVPLRILDADHVQLTHVATDGTETTLLRGTDYAIDGVEDPDGFTVDFPEPSSSFSTLATGEKIVVLRQVPADQQMDLRNQGGFYPEVVENAFDKVVMLLQQLSEKVNRAFQLPVGTDGSVNTLLQGFKASRYLAVNGTGTALEFVDAEPGETTALRQDLRGGNEHILGFQSSQSATYSDADTLTTDTTTTDDAGEYVYEVGRRVRVYLKASDRYIYGVIQALGTRGTSGTVDIASGSSLANENLTIWVHRDRVSDQYYFNVKWFGAAGDGVTDDSGAVQAAVDFMPSSGGVVYLPRGNYLFSSSVNIAKDNVKVLGDGVGTWIRNGTTDSPAILAGDGGTRRFKISVSDIRIGQESGVTPVSGNCALKADTIGQSNFRNIYTAEFPSALFEGLVFDDVSQTVFENLSVQGCTDDGIVFFNCLDVYLSNSRSDANGNTGFAFQDCEGVYAQSCTAAVRNEIAWHIRTSAGVNPQINMWFTDCIGDESNNHNWLIDRVNVGTFTNCWGSGQNGATGGVSTARGFVIQGSDTTDISFHGCIALDNNTDGFVILNGGGVPSRITFDCCLAGSDYGVDIPNGQHGFNIAYGTDIAVTGSRARGNGAYGINIGGSPDVSNILVADNFLQSNSSGAVQSAGPSGLIYRDNYGYTTYNYGNASVSPDGFGKVFINHGLAATPSYANVNLRGYDTNHIDVESVNSTQVVGHITDAAGADVTTGTFTVDWEARV